MKLHGASQVRAALAGTVPFVLLPQTCPKHRQLSPTTNSCWVETRTRQVLPVAPRSPALLDTDSLWAWLPETPSQHAVLERNRCQSPEYTQARGEVRLRKGSAPACAEDRSLKATLLSLPGPSLGKQENKYPIGEIRPPSEIQGSRGSQRVPCQS